MHLQTAPCSHTMPPAVIPVSQQSYQSASSHIYSSAQDTLLVAARKGDADAVRALLSEPYSYYVDHRYDIDAGCDGFDGRKTALHCAVGGGWEHVEVVVVLLEHRVTVDARSSPGDTPLHLCCEYGCGDGCDADAMKAASAWLLRLTWKSGQGGSFTESSLNKVLSITLSLPHTVSASH